LRFYNGTLIGLQPSRYTTGLNPTAYTVRLHLGGKLTGCLTPATDLPPDSNQWREKGSQSFFRGQTVFRYYYRSKNRLTGLSEALTVWAPFDKLKYLPNLL